MSNIDWNYSIEQMYIDDKRWVVAYYLSKDYGNFQFYKRKKFKNSRETLVRMGVIKAVNSDIEMKEFVEYKGNVYWSAG